MRPFQKCPLDVRTWSSVSVRGNPCEHRRKAGGKGVPRRFTAPQGYELTLARSDPRGERSSSGPLVIDALGCRHKNGAWEVLTVSPSGMGACGGDFSPVRVSETVCTLNPRTRKMEHRRGRVTNHKTHHSRNTYLNTYILTNMHT